MKKRILSAILTLVLLVSLVPAGAVSASAATYSSSEAMITVLKNLETYKSTCTKISEDRGIIGYGTVCTEKKPHGTHTTTETKADKALRAELKKLDETINGYAAKKGLALTQAQHDALVMFSYDNGTAWTTGTGDFQSAVAQKLTGSKFLGAICRWSETDSNARRMVEANMYLNGVYSAKAPASFITVTYDPDGGKMNEDTTQYYDTTTNPTADITPTRTGYRFVGWYTEGGTRITKLTKNRNLVAYWQEKDAEPGSVDVNYKLTLDKQTALYDSPTAKASDWAVKGKVTIDSEYVDKKGVRWGRVATAEKLYEDGKKIDEDVDLTGSADWIKLAAKGGAADSTGGNVTVTVTNTYLRVREDASIYSTELRQVHAGDKLKIVDTKNGADGFLWGKIEGDQGWVALMYTDYNSVKEQTTVTNTNAIAKAVITVNGYVNVRSDAGTVNQIVGALSKGTEVDIYQTQYVNGVLWGRCNSGWFCLTGYANVTNLVNIPSGFASYAFAGELNKTGDTYPVYTTAGGTKAAKLDEKFEEDIVVTSLKLVKGDIWGKIPEGWVNLDDVKLSGAKFSVIAADLPVKTSASASAEKVDTLSKGVELTIKKLAIAEDSLWGYSETYAGWVQINTTNLSYQNPPAVKPGTTNNGGTTSYTGTIATIVGANSVNVRAKADIYSTAIGKISLGTKVPVLGEKNGWYKIDYDVDDNDSTDSWVYKDYVSLSEGTLDMGSDNAGSNTGSTGTEAAPETGWGIVANTYSGVNIRTGPGTGYNATGKILPGTTIQIYETTVSGVYKWGRTDKGWVCMDYVTMLTDAMAGELGLGGITGGNTGNGTNGSITTAEPAIFEGAAIANDVAVYKTTKKNDDEIIRTLNAGDPITLHEILTVVEYEDKEVVDSEDNEGATSNIQKKVTYWARINDGYVAAPGDVLELNALESVTYTLSEDYKEGDKIFFFNYTEFTVI